MPELYRISGDTTHPTRALSFFASRQKDIQDMDLFRDKSRKGALDWETACRQVLARFEFLGDLDDRDQLFLDLVKSLLGKPYPRAREENLHEIEHPLAWLMEGLPISAEARAMTQEDIQLHQPDTKAKAPFLSLIPQIQLACFPGNAAY